METYANQKTIKVNKEVCDKEHLYSMNNLDALQQAMNNLKGEAFKLWCYLAKNQPGYVFALSSVDAVKNWGIGCDKSYDRAVRTLIERGYLIETSKNHYDFYEIPPVRSKYDGIQITIQESTFTF